MRYYMIAGTTGIGNMGRHAGLNFETKELLHVQFSCKESVDSVVFLNEDVVENVGCEDGMVQPIKNVKLALFSGNEPWKTSYNNGGLTKSSIWNGAAKGKQLVSMYCSAPEAAINSFLNTYGTNDPRWYTYQQAFALVGCLSDQERYNKISTERATNMPPWCVRRTGALEREFEYAMLSLKILNPWMAESSKERYDVTKHGKIKWNPRTRNSVWAGMKGVLWMDGTKKDPDNSKLIEAVGLYKLSALHVRDMNFKTVGAGAYCVPV